MTPHTMDAAGLTRAAAGDPQLTPPARPCATPGVMTAWLRDGFVVEGLHSRRVLRGTSTRALLTAVLPLLDGTRTHDELASESGIDADAIRQVLMILFAAGLLVDGEPGDASDPVLTFLHRASDETRSNPSGREALARVAAARVRLLGEVGALPSLARQLGASGVSAVDDAEEADDRPAGLPDLAIAVLTSRSREAVVGHARRLREDGVPVLPVHVEADGVVVGPVSYPDFGPCLECAAGQVDLDVLPMGSTVGRLIGAVVAQEAVLMISETGSAQTMNNALRVTSSPLRTEALAMHSRPGCPTCGGGGPLVEEPPVAYRFETAVAMLPARLRRPRGHQKHYEPSSVSLQYEQRTIPGREAVVLPEVHAVDPVERDGTLDLAAVSRLLQLSFGVHRRRSEEESAIRRWTPTGGNLGSPQAYLSCAGVPSLDDGRWFFDAGSRSLTRLRDPGSALPEGLRLTVVCEVSRVWSKYNIFGYRIVHLDTGAALASLRLAAASAGLAVGNHLAWDDASLEGEFGIDAKEQIVTAHLEITGGHHA
ncbi:hypothetical protein ACPEEZ_12975 [Frigoribacterium sp. 2-23]|uniref:hypothetical protein n=1 Tax=Frigoribacterium sp. 2-23 TaxID=3415006 RepID=UPI003C6FA0B1